MNPIFKDIVAQWYDRPGTLRVCTEWVLGFLPKLKAHNPAAFSVWYEFPDRKACRNKSLTKKVASYEDVKQLMIDGTIKQGDLYTQGADGSIQVEEGSVADIIQRCHDEVYNRLAYRPNLWNGLYGLEDASLYLGLGSKFGNRYWADTCKLALPQAGPTHAYYQIAANQQALIQVFKDYWQPNYMLLDGKRTIIQAVEGHISIWW